MPDLNKLTKSDCVITAVKHKYNPDNDSTSTNVVDRPSLIVTDSKPANSVGSPLVNGWRSPNGYSRTVTKTFPLSGVLNTHDQVDSDDVTWSETTFVGPCGLWLGNYPDPLSLPGYALGTNVVHRAETECLAKVRTLQVQYGVAIVEAQRSVETIRDLALSGVSILRDIKKGRVSSFLKTSGYSKTGTKRAAKKVASLSASGWLQYNYAVKPIILDIGGAITDIQNGLSKDGSHVTAIRNIKTNFSDRDTVIFDQLIRVNRNVSGFRGVKVRLDYSMSSEWTNKVMDSGVLRFDEIAWEFVPWSFVIDWALPIGTTLAALGAGAGLDFKAGTKTSYSQSESYTNGSVGRSYDRSNTGQRYGNCNLNSSQYVNSMARSVYQTPPEASLYVKNPISTSHATSALALLVNGFQGLRR